MANPILQNLNRQAPTQMSASNPMQMLQQFGQFRQQMQGKNPQQMVNELRQSGQMSDSQFNALQQQAQNLLPFFRR